MGLLLIHGGGESGLFPLILRVLICSLFVLDFLLHVQFSHEKRCMRAVGKKSTETRYFCVLGAEGLTVMVCFTHLCTHLHRDIKV